MQVQRVLFGNNITACQFKLDNLTIIVDRNNFQQTGSSNSILNLENLKNKFESFGCFVLIWMVTT